MSEESAKFKIKEETVVAKYDGEPLPENLIERVYLEDGNVLKHEFIENGVVTRVDLVEHNSQGKGE